MRRNQKAERINNDLKRRIFNDSINQLIREFKNTIHNIRLNMKTFTLAFVAMVASGVKLEKSGFRKGRPANCIQGEDCLAQMEADNGMYSFAQTEKFDGRALAYAQTERSYNEWNNGPLAYAQTEQPTHQFAQTEQPTHQFAQTERFGRFDNGPLAYAQTEYSNVPDSLAYAQTESYFGGYYA